MDSCCCYWQVFSSLNAKLIVSTRPPLLWRPSSRIPSFTVGSWIRCSGNWHLYVLAWWGVRDGWYGNDVMVWNVSNHKCQMSCQIFHRVTKVHSWTDEVHIRFLPNPIFCSRSPTYASSSDSVTFADVNASFKFGFDEVAINRFV